MNKRVLGAILLAVVLFGGLMLIGFDVANFDEFLNALKAIWFALLGILAR